MSGWRDRVPRWLPPVVAACAIAGLVAWSAWQRWQLLAVTPFPVGIDGYFYPIELRSLLESGHLQYPASPLALWWMLPFAAVTDPITGAKLGAAIGGALVAVPAYFAGGRLGRSRGAGLVCAAVATMSIGSTYLTVEFVKNGIGLAVALAALALVLRAVERPQLRARDLVAAAVAVIAAVLAHKMAAALVVVIGGPAVAVRVPRRWAIAGAAAIAGAVVIGSLAPQRFVSVADLALLRDLFSPHAAWSAPALAMPGLEITGNHEALAGAVVAIVGAVGMIVASRAATPRAIRAAQWATLGLAVAIAIPWLAVDDPQGLGFRLRLAAYVPLALAAAIAARLLVHRLAHLDADALLLAIALAIVLRTPSRRAIPGEVIPHPAMVAAVTAQPIAPDTTVIVPERQLAFMIAWYKRAPVSLRPLPAGARTVRVIALHWMGEFDSPLDHALDLARQSPEVDPPIGTHPGYANGLVQVSERTWLWLLAHLPPADRAYFATWPTI